MMTSHLFRARLLAQIVLSLCGSEQMPTHEKLSTKLELKAEEEIVLL